MAAGMKKYNRYVILSVLCVSESMYLLPYLRWTFYDTMIEGFGFTNTQLATLGSVFGLMSLIGYLVGGPISDRFSPKKILVTAFLLTGIGGFWFAMYPPFWACVIIHIIWGVATAVLLWDCMMRLTRSLASSQEQGWFFGLLEGGRGAVDTVTSFILVGLFAALGSTVASLQQVMLILAAFNVIGIILVLIFVPDELLRGEDDDKINVHEIIDVLKTPAVWLIAIVILCNYSIYTGGTYLTSYLTDIIGVSVSVSAVISVFRNFVLMMLGGPVGGFLGDRFSISKVITACFVFICIALGAFVLFPVDSSLVIPVVMMMALYLGVFLMRGIYFGTVDQAKIPMKITGTAVGIISLVGFFPEVFMNSISGYLLDAHPGYDGYHYLFIIMLVFAVAGFIAAILLQRNIEENAKG